MDKKNARERMRLERRKLSRTQIETYSRQIEEKLLSLSEFKNNNNIFSYVSYNNEVDTYGIISKCFQMNKGVFVPKVYGKEMKFHKITSLNELKKGSFDIPEPDNDIVTHEKEGLIIMPGLAFDKAFSRVGYGGGYYDRYLHKYTELIKVAVCFDFQILDEDIIESEPLDLKPDMIVTEKRILKRTNIL